jgi:hypothetical protein
MQFVEYGGADQLLAHQVAEDVPDVLRQALRREGSAQAVYDRPGEIGVRDAMHGNDVFQEGD